MGWDSVTGVILAGGAGRRFGGDKASALFLGRPLLEVVGAALAAVCGRVVVVAPAGRELPEIGVAFERFDDAFPGEGPLGGVVTAFRALGGGRAFVAACDTPLLEAGVVRDIVGRLRHGVECAAPVVSGVRQPLAAAYDVGACIGPFERLFQAGERRMMAALEAVAVAEVVLEGAAARALRSVNTRLELESLAREVGLEWGSGELGRG